MAAHTKDKPAGELEQLRVDPPDQPVRRGASERRLPALPVTPPARPSLAADRCGSWKSRAHRAQATMASSSSEDNEPTTSAATVSLSLLHPSMEHNMETALSS